MVGVDEATQRPHSCTVVVELSYGQPVWQARRKSGKWVSSSVTIQGSTGIAIRGSGSIVLLLKRTCQRCVTVKINCERGTLVWDLERLNELRVSATNSAGASLDGLADVIVCEPGHPFMDLWSRCVRPLWEPIVNQLLM